MPKKLTQEQFIQRVKEAVGDKYTILSQYNGKNNPITMKCNIHNIDFIVNAECFMRGSKDVRGSCPICSEEQKNERLKDSREKVKCAYCGKEFVLSKSKAEKSKSGFHFCCREHKDLAQTIDFGLKEIWPDHYAECTSVYNYRKKAFREYPNKCSVCGWNEDIDILEVHHIDEDRENNELDNLIILCPICHRKLTNHKYKLINREQIVLC